MNPEQTGPRALGRGCLALIFLIGAHVAFDPVEAAIYAPLARALDLHMIVHGELSLAGYGALMVVRLGLELALVAGVLAILRRPWPGFPLSGPRPIRLSLIGLVTGFVVMASAIVLIMAGHGASVSVAAQPAASAILHGAGWVAFDYLGAAGEELYGRVAVLLVAQSIAGWRVAILVSGLVFSALHLGSPGVDRIWLLRLFLQGMLLAYAVYRTGSVWWSIGYHTGWNWASAPLFGAAGSGYLDQGHLMDFRPTGSPWITGGPVGPEGSLLAFLAMACALGLLVAVTRPRRA